MNALVCILVGLLAVICGLGAFFLAILGITWIIEKFDGGLSVPKSLPVIVVVLAATGLVGLLVAYAHDLGCHIRGHQEHEWFPEKSK